MSNALAGHLYGTELYADLQGQIPKQARVIGMNSQKSVLLKPGYIYILVRGMVELRAIHEDGETTLVELVLRGQVFEHIESKAMGCEAYSCSAALALEVPKDAIFEHPRLLEMLLKQSRERIQRLWVLNAVQRQAKVEDRVWGVLNWFAEYTGRPTERGTMIGFRLTHQQLASLVGSTRPTITRLMNRWKLQRCLTVTGRGADQRLLLACGSK